MRKIFWIVSAILLIGSISWMTWSYTGTETVSEADRVLYDQYYNKTYTTFEYEVMSKKESMYARLNREKDITQELKWRRIPEKITNREIKIINQVGSWIALTLTLFFMIYQLLTYYLVDQPRIEQRKKEQEYRNANAK